MNTRQSLISRIEEKCRASGMTEREFGYAAVQDGRFVDRLRSGKATLKVIEKAEEYLDGKALDARALRRRSVAAHASAA